MRGDARREAGSGYREVKLAVRKGVICSRTRPGMAATLSGAVIVPRLQNCVPLFQGTRKFGQED